LLIFKNLKDLLIILFGIIMDLLIKFRTLNKIKSFLRQKLIFQTYVDAY